MRMTGTEDRAYSTVRYACAVAFACDWNRVTLKLVTHKLYRGRESLHPHHGTWSSPGVLDLKKCMRTYKELYNMDLELIMDTEMSRSHIARYRPPSRLHDSKSKRGVATCVMPLHEAQVVLRLHSLSCPERTIPEWAVWRISFTMQLCWFRVVCSGTVFASLSEPPPHPLARLRGRRVPC